MAPLTMLPVPNWHQPSRGVHCGPRRREERHMLFIDNEVQRQILTIAADCINAQEIAFKELSTGLEATHRPAHRRLLCFRRSARTRTGAGAPWRASARSWGCSRAYPHEVGHPDLARGRGRQLDGGEAQHAARPLLRPRVPVQHAERGAAGHTQRRHHPAHARGRRGGARGQVPRQETPELPPLWLGCWGPWGDGSNVELQAFCCPPCGASSEPCMWCTKSDA